MKTVTIAFLALASLALILGSQASAAPPQHLTQKDRQRLAPRAVSDRVPVLQGHPVPHWWPTYFPYRNHVFTPFLVGDHIDESRLADFRQQVQLFESIRGNALRHNDLTAEERQILSTPFNSWVENSAHRHPTNVVRAKFAEDATKLQEMHRVFARFMPHF
ncbi:uncharacterized protein UMAG_04035 [Mycosarcoma maydis]|uniref:Uncharacterized protein n=1 Tax=Mycosarcoma maydis TaxID=5270 RepID=A0A0D1DWK2_MYCMD|nr:uncharacterized protein UMAG_04035 [Ustilago maydis 521]KIS67991.1 hypothetical protein UMAG_04035 [Ustilago maydis 521]|eukprot:XP_011390480.1 hypothetical protein UMAG_04035 [Ustilago maydis 521]